MPDDPLALFLPPVQHWFRAALGEPTPVQRLGWPKIAAGENTLLLAPTGSGKTLAAFLACLDGLWRQPDLPRGLKVLYISPLKALNNDIHRNLQAPLAGVQEAARQLDFPLPALEAAVRTGDTSTAERQRLIRRPPHVLITTPESLHLLLTSRARETLRGITHCIVDEIHALCPNKRGVFLSLLLERLEAINANSFVRIGLSATQRPLDEVARYLGGRRFVGGESSAPLTPNVAYGEFIPRPVAIVDAGFRKNLDLRVVSPVEQFGPLPERTIWPSIIRLLAREVESHRSTIIFANNRRGVERITTLLNEELQSESTDGEPEAVLVRAHHGSVALEVRQQTEQGLKEGRLRAVVATASLELGIDMGAVELVCQVESPGSVARALQRVGRAGHLVGQDSKGRLIPKTLPDLLNQAVLAAEMAAGRVEPIHTPQNCLDVLAQQVVAAVAMDEWAVDDLYRLVRQAYPYRDLTPQAFEAVLEMVTGRFRFLPNDDDDDAGGDTRRLTSPVREEGMIGSADQPTRRLTSPVQGHRVTPVTALHPRISWDRVHHRLHPLPGSQKLALVNGGTIPDTGQFAVYARNNTRIGEVDEEFVFERRVGEVFMLGTNAWRIDRIDADRVHVVPAEGAPAMIPFWRGEQAGRTWDLGLAQGKFLRQLAVRMDQPDCLEWLQRDYFLDAAAAHNLRAFVRRQIARTDAVPTDKTVIVEASRDPLGDWQVVLLTPFGSRFHHTLKLALESVLRRRLGYRPQCLHHDDGVLIRLTDSDEPVLDIFEGLTPESLRQHILDELGDSALFALRFRQNAGRALLMPRGTLGRRAPLWLQRLRGRDLLQVARRHPDFPIVIETFRECLRDHLDVPRVEEWLRDLQAGAIEVKSCRLDVPSPFAASLLFSFVGENMYVYNVVDAEPGQASARLDQHLLDQLIASTGHELALDPRAIQQVERRLRGIGQPPRTPAETAEWLRKLGDVADSEVEGAALGMLRELAEQGRVQRIRLRGVANPERWVLTEEAPTYQLVFGDANGSPADKQAAGAAILQRFLDTHALVSLRDVLARYPLEEKWAREQLEAWANKGRVVAVPPAADAEPMQWSAPANYQQAQRGTLAILRREVVTCPAWQFADFVIRWQKAHPATRLRGADGLADVLAQLQAVSLPAHLWEEAVLPTRSADYQPRWLDEILAGGDWLWLGRGTGARGIDELAFVPHEALGHLPLPAPTAEAHSLAVDRVHEVLRQRGACFVPDLAQQLGLSPSAVRSALWQLVRLGLATNDQFEVARRGEQALVEETERVPKRHGGAGSTMRPARVRPRASARPEGRWSLIPWQHPDLETQAFAAARMLLRRYGVLARELALLDERLPPWRLLYEVLTRLELAGEVRRGWFVEGLSGAQFALPEAAKMLHELALPSHSQAPMVLFSSVDPANLYGGPLEVPDEIPRPFARRPSNWLVLRAGKPVLLIEQHGKRVTTLAARDDDLAAAVACLPALITSNPRRDLRTKLTVEEWNGQPVTATVGKDLLADAGFVRDYQAMTLYAVWSK